MTDRETLLRLFEERSQQTGLEKTTLAVRMGINAGFYERLQNDADIRKVTIRKALKWFDENPLQDESRKA